MNIVFMGTPDFAVPSLEALLEAEYRVVGVVTQPDRPKGRKKTLTPPPVKLAAERYGLPVLQPERLRAPEAVKELAALQPDLIVTAAYGQILPKSVLDMPRYGCLNVHASLLPRYRGAAPIQYAIMNGDAATGVTVMYMAEGLDTGDMISSVTVPIGADDDAGSMFAALSEAGAQLLLGTLPKLLAGELRAVPQRDEEATYAKMLKRDDERIDWSRSSRDIANQVRALRPAPGAFTLWNGETLKVWRCAPLDAARPSAAAPGEVVCANADGIDVCTGDGVLRITELQPAGKKAMSAAELLNGGKLTAGAMLGGQGSAL